MPQNDARLEGTHLISEAVTTVALAAPGKNPGFPHLVGKYDLDLFYLGPFYHLLLPHLDKLIVVDLDVEFR